MTEEKVCTICKDPKSLDDFNKKSNSKDGRQNVCKSCSQKQARKYYKKHKTKHKAAVAQHKKLYKEANRLFMIEYLSTHPCVDCGEKDIRCLEFDHVRGNKTTNVSFMLKNVCSIETISKEIEKCDVRCANCHRKRTSDIQSWYKSGP